MKLVVVDDNHVNLEIFELTLELIEASAELFDNGRDALDYLGRCPGIPDVMIVDRLMPGMDGLAVVKAVRSNERFATMKILMASASAAASEVESGLAAGVDTYLVKLFSPQELLDTLKTLSPS